MFLRYVLISLGSIHLGMKFPGGEGRHIHSLSRYQQEFLKIFALIYTPTSKDWKLHISHPTPPISLFTFFIVVKYI